MLEWLPKLTVANAAPSGTARIIESSFQSSVPAMETITLLPLAIALAQLGLEPESVTLETSLPREQVEELFAELNIAHSAVLATQWKSAVGIKGKYRAEQKQNAQAYVQKHYAEKLFTETLDTAIIMSKI